MPVPTLVTVTVAPGTTAPEGSVTSPVTVAASCCAPALAAVRITTKKRAPTVCTPRHTLLAAGVGDGCQCDAGANVGHRDRGARDHGTGGVRDFTGDGGRILLRRGPRRCENYDNENERQLSECHGTTSSAAISAVAACTLVRRRNRHVTLAYRSCNGRRAPELREVRARDTLQEWFTGPSRYCCSLLSRSHGGGNTPTAPDSASLRFTPRVPEPGVADLVTAETGQGQIAVRATLSGPDPCWTLGGELEQQIEK